MQNNGLTATLNRAVFNKLMKETADSVNKSGTNIRSAEIQEIASVKMFQYLTNHNDYKIPEEQRNSL